LLASIQSPFARARDRRKNKLDSPWAYVTLTKSTQAMDTQCHMFACFLPHKVAGGFNCTLSLMSNRKREKKCRVIGLSDDDAALLMDRWTQTAQALCRICTINLFAESLITPWLARGVRIVRTLYGKTRSSPTDGASKGREVPLLTAEIGRACDSLLRFITTSIARAMTQIN
jgi:hypothetical protein